MFKKEKNKIIFRAQSEHVMEVRLKPVPANKVMPEWWDNASTYINDNKGLRLLPAPAVTVKRCFPMLDAIGAGYIMPLWADIFVSENKHADSEPYVQWLTDEPVLDSWNSTQSNPYEYPEGYSKVVFKYMHGWTIKTPPGWSCLITHPIGYNNLPIKTITGVVDTDTLETDANSPFLIKNGFEGLIKKGTPMFQIIPFKRSNWESEYLLEEKNQHYFNLEKLRTNIVSSYGRQLRSQKSYK
jgi:hypothetical protein